jgi:perosamine synthetase
MIFNPIAISLSPNTDRNDVLHAVKILFQPWCWINCDNNIRKVENWFVKYFKVKDAVSFNSGRSALYALFKYFDIGKNDEVIIQGFTCVAVPNAVKWVGAIPVYSDVDESLNIDYRYLEKIITRKTKVIVVQHTFGVAADIIKIKEIAQKHNIILIEDCAHSLGATLNNRKIGTFGHASFFSFGRDKIVSSVFGGIAIINSSDLDNNKKLRFLRDNFPEPSLFFVLQQLLHPIFFSLILPFYNIIIGKVLILFLQYLRLLSYPVYKKEKSGDKPDDFPRKYSNALAYLLLPQLGKLEKMNKHRIFCAKYYQTNIKNKHIKLPGYKEGSIYLRYNILTSKSDEIYKKAKKIGILLGRWYSNVIDPVGVLFDKIGYKVGSLKKAEKYSELSLNLPTYFRLDKDGLKKIVNILNDS